MSRQDCAPGVRATPCPSVDHVPVPPHRSEGRRLGDDMGIDTMHDHERTWGPAPARRPARSDLATRSLQGHEATYAAVGALVATLQEMHAQATRRGLRMTLVAVGVSNAADIADAHGAGTLEHVTETVVRRGMGAGVELRPLRISPLGGALAVLLSPPLRAEESADLVAARMRGQVWTTDDDIWPVVTLGLRAFSDEHRAEDLLRDVRATLLDAARRRPGGVQWFRPEVLSRPGQDLALLRDLAQALERPEQIALAYQPVRCLATGRTRAVEALLRWTHPARGPVPALAAVAAAERSGLVHRLGALVLDQALAAAAGWRRQGSATTVHVNVSPVELRDPGYAERVADLLGRHAVPPAGLLLEVTETDVMTGDADVLATLLRLRRLGVGIGIDDFGTGYSSISHLHRLPVDTVKVDRSLIAGIATSPADLDLVRAVLALLATAPVEVVVEGVETAAQVDCLRALGCDLAQGYHLGRPGPVADLDLGSDGAPGAAWGVA